MSLPPKLEKEIEELRRDHVVDVVEEAEWINLIFRCFSIPEAYSVTSADLLVRVQRAYPDAGPDMFWLEVPLTLAGGGVPQSADAIEAYAGCQWRRFSWHKQAWHPSVDNLHGYLEFIRRRLLEKK